MVSFFSVGLVVFFGILYCVFTMLYEFSLNEIVWLRRAAKVIAIFCGVCSAWLILESLADAKNIALQYHIYGFRFLHLLTYKFREGAFSTIPFMLMALFSGICGTILRFKKGTQNLPTGGHFGTANWADKRDLMNIRAYSRETGPFIGTDEKGRSLYLPLCNKLTISPPGGGKTTASSIPVLLSHNGPVFAFDIKGELWATTARYRSEVLGREIVVIDPYGVTQGKDFKLGKPEKLLKKYNLNPFDWVPEHKSDRDRMINAFASSFIVSDNSYSNHFDENAKILIRGYIDYLMSFPKEERTLNHLFTLMSENLKASEATFEHMALSHGRSEAAANQIKRVSSEERGSILSTSYRQIDWMSDSNIQSTLSESNFDLRDFLKGNMDIFVVLPEDQIKEHNRLVRMIMSLLMSLIVQADPSELPKYKILFLLDELAQLGYCPDVEQCIEVLRARGVVVWTVFQSLNQIDLFKKPDLFKGAPLKQIFTIDDAKTMDWIQRIGGKKTVVTQTTSTNQLAPQKGGFLQSGTSSKGESTHETGVDLVPINEILELPNNEQFIFLHGSKPIRCKKVRYFEHPDFRGKYDNNPLESKNADN